MKRIAGLAAALACATSAWSQTAANVLVVVNEQDPLSRRIGAYYVHRRTVPLANVCRIFTTSEETVPWQVYRQEIEEPVARCLRTGGLAEKVLYIVTTSGVPLRVSGAGTGPGAESAATDSELALLYAKIKRASFPRMGAVPNPFFGKHAEAFAHPRFPIYLVTRLAGYDFADVQAMIDRATAAHNRGAFVIDLKSAESGPGNDWLREAARLLPPGRVVLDETETVLYGRQDVIGYASWGSNDVHRKRRFLGFRWLPGAIATEFVSTDGRTFRRPPDDWTLGTWKDPKNPPWFAGAPQSLTADYLHEGATGCSGHVDEPFLGQTPRPDYLLPAYCSGRTLAESYYLSIPSLSWQNIVVGDPLCRLVKP